MVKAQLIACVFHQLGKLVNGYDGRQEAAPMVLPSHDVTMKVLLQSLWHKLTP